MNCLGDTGDAVYQGTANLLLDEDTVYAVAGTLGTQTDNATYVGLGLNASMRKFGFENIPHTELIGTANAYDSQVANTDKFFLAYIARSCTGLEELTQGSQCYEVSEETLPPCDDLTNTICDALKISLRDYIRPGTQRGPAALLKLHSTVITLHRP